MRRRIGSRTTAPIEAFTNEWTIRLRDEYLALATAGLQQMHHKIGQQSPTNPEPPHSITRPVSAATIASPLRGMNLFAVRSAIYPLLLPYKRTGAFFAAIPSSVIRYASSFPVPWLSIQCFSSNRCSVMGVSGSRIALTQPRPRSHCMN